MKRLFQVCSVLAALLLAGCHDAAAAPKMKAEGADLVFGGQGEGKGRFFDIADITFDRAGNLYVLDGLVYDKKEKKWLGNALVQKFDANGKWLSQFSTRNAELGDKDSPVRLAVDNANRVYVVKRAASRVEQYAPDGKLLGGIEIPGVSGIANWKGKIAAIGGTFAQINRKRVMLGGDEIAVLNAEGNAIESRIELERALQNVETLAADSEGNFYVLAGSKQLFKLDANGKTLQTIGAGAAGKERFFDGSQLAEALAIDARGNIAAGAWGSAAFFDPKFETITQRPGRFNIGTGWGGRTRFAFAPDGRLWVAATQRNDAKADPKGRYFADKPAVMRLAANYFEPKERNVSVSSTLTVGFMPQISTAVPYHVAMQPGPFPLVLSVAPAARRIQEIDARWRLLDAFGAQVDKGTFKLPLKDDEAAQQAFSVSPPRNGWFAVVMEYVNGNRVLRTEAKWIGVTPRYAGMDAPASDDPKQIGPKGGWEDPVRQVFSGLTFIRFHPAKSLDRLDKDIDAANKAGANFIVQLTDEKDVAPDAVRALVTRFKGRIPIYEIINEPNISLKGGLNRYTEIWKEIAPIIKGIDPAAKLMGPATVNIDLPFIDKFFAACAPLVDMVSVHDYEGHGTYEATHWNWKFGELRKLMAKYGLKDKPLWQTERADGAVFRSNFQGLHQAVNLSYHYDLLQSLGVPPERNQHYYLNEGGYSSVATYVWSKSGPHPAALAMRTRHAQTRNRAYLGTVDFGPSGNKFFFGLRYGPRDGDGGLILVRNLGNNEVPLPLQTTGAPSVRDAFDNAVAVPANKTLTIGQMPIYIQLPAGATVEFPKWNWGRNFASEAKFTYSAPTTNPAAPVADPKDVKTELIPGVIEATPEDAVPNPNNLLPILLTPDPAKLLVNGILETHHHGGLYGGARATPMFRGDIPSFPQTLDITFPTARPISRLAVFSERGDNGYCALLDYDVQGWQNGAWKTLAEVRTPVPVSTPAEAFQTTTLTWMQDPNRTFVQFAAPVSTDRLRLVIRRTSFGFAPDEGLRGWSTILKPQLMLKEIEIY